MPKRRPNPFALPQVKRKRLSKKRRARLFLERGGRCHRCREKIEAGSRWVVEHYTSLENGGTNDWHNLDLTCPGCFHPKNKEDRGKAKKGRKLRERQAKHRERMEGKLIPVDVRGDRDDGGNSRRKPKTAWPSRPMPCGKASKHKRTMRGVVVPR